MGMRLNLLSSKAIYQRSINVASLMKKNERKFNFYHSLVLDVDDHFELHTGRESHVDSDVDGWKA